MISARGWAGLMEAVRGAGQSGLTVVELELDGQAAELLVLVAAAWSSRQRVAVHELVTGEMYPHVADQVERTAWYRLYERCREARLTPLVAEGPCWWRRPARYSAWPALVAAGPDAPEVDPLRDRDWVGGAPGPAEVGLMRLEALCVPLAAFERMAEGRRGAPLGVRAVEGRTVDGAGT